MATGTDIVRIVVDRPLVKIALGAVPSSGGSNPTGLAGGDLGGTYPNPSVSKVAGVTPGATGLALLDDGTAAAARATLELNDPGVNEQYLVLAADQAESASVLTDVAGLAFTPQPNTTYFVEFFGCWETAVATTALRLAFQGPTGTVYGTQALRVQNSSAGVDVRLGALGSETTGTAANATTNNNAEGWAIFKTGASPSGDFRVQIRSEIGGSAVTLKAGAFLRYRKLA